MSDKLQFVARCAKAAQKQQTEVRRNPGLRIWRYLSVLLCS